MDANLKTRICAAVVLIPIAVGSVLWLPSSWFSCFVAVFVLLAAWEWGALIGWRQTVLRLVYVGTVGVALVFFWLRPVYGDALLLAGLAYWLLCLVLLVAAQAGRSVTALDSTMVRSLAGWLTLVPAWWGLTWIHMASESGPVLALLVLMLVWAADIGAYFSGRRFGRNKLASRLSPGKTWEGVYGALSAVAVLAGLFVLFGPVPGGHAGTFFLLCMAVGVISVAGDLMESLFKRRAGVKDSGGLIPGHGGVLDRVDSITAAAPCFAFGLGLMERWS